MKIRTAASLALGILALSTFNGCAYMANAMLGMAHHVELKQDLAHIRQETRARYKEEEREAAREAALQVQIQDDLCEARKQAVRQRVQDQLRDVVDSKVAFNVSQSLDVGELEVDVEALKELLKKRDEPRPAEPFRDNPTQKGPFQKGSLQKGVCKCAEQECGCRPGLWKKFCHRCKHKECDCEEDCGGPEAFRQLAQEPVRQPIRPQEIPLKLPVRLRIGMGRPEVQKAAVRSEPIQQPPRAPFRGKKGESGFEGNNGAEPPPPFPVVEPDFDEVNLPRSTTAANLSRPIRKLHTPVSFNQNESGPTFLGASGYANESYQNR